MMAKEHEVVKVLVKPGCRARRQIFGGGHRNPLRMRELK